MKLEKYLVVGREALPVETSMVVDNVEHALTCAKEFLPGGSMWRDGDKGVIVIYIPGTEIPADLAKAAGLEEPKGRAYYPDEKLKKGDKTGKK